MYVYVVNGRLGRVRATTVAVERQEYCIFSVYTCSIRCPACNANALYCHLCPVRLYNIFPNYLTKARLSKKKILNIKCVFCFSLQLLSETSAILQIIQRVIIKLYIGLHVKCSLFLSDLMKLECSRHIIKKHSNIKHNEKPPSGN